MFFSVPSLAPDIEIKLDEEGFVLPANRYEEVYQRLLSFTYKFIPCLIRMEKGKEMQVIISSQLLGSLEVTTD